MTNPLPAWDTTVLDTATIIDIPDRLPEQPDPHLRLALAAMTSQAAGHPDTTIRVARLAHAGIVAIRTSIGCFEIRELLDGWLLVHHPGDPDPTDLAAAALLRARRLARTRLARTRLARTRVADSGNGT
ncbi:hypothetical protein [Frankia sp. Cas4]|uniref:hypothetical protein n=1 Tax=Frankia sp. Cas4 TaxID=3073927 RepID=UPI002AD5A31B|nr:hypothetical protein [Frankia sp. Cas4]